MTLGKSEIIQIDATVIMGVLILLSLSLDTSGTRPTLIVFSLEMIKGGAIISIVFPFAWSAIRVIKAYLDENSSHPSKNQTIELNGALWLMQIGFQYLAIGIGIIIILQLLIKFFLPVE